MPGLSFISDTAGRLAEKRSAISKALDTILHDEYYDKTLLLDDSCYVLALSYYEGYPLSYFENSRFYICFEGKIYGKTLDLIHDELINLANSAAQYECRGGHRIAEWLLNSDGDFVVFILDKQCRSITIINDVLGRLPLYCYSTDTQCVISREFSFIASLKEEKNFDKMGIAQNLLFGYSLGSRTLLADVCRVAPSTMIQINIARPTITITNLHRFNFDLKPYSGRTISQNSSELEQAFIQACTNRAAMSKKNVVALSGGFDSRAVAACLHQQHIPFSAVTCRPYDGRADLDCSIVQELTDVFALDWNASSLKPPLGRDILHLLRLKNGMNNLGMSFILAFFSEVRQTYGLDIQYWTGDGGDKLLPDISSEKSLKNANDLVHYVISNNHEFSLENVVALTGVTKQDIIDEMQQIFLQYPERILEQKYTHFLLYERAFKRLFEGEDRNRCYFWSISPFYAIEFFRYAMGCPDTQKAKYVLYRHFLTRLSRLAAEIKSTHWGMPITSQRYQIWLLVRAMVINRIPRSLRKALKRTPAYPGLGRYREVINTQHKHCHSIKQHFSSPSLQAILQKCNRTQIEFLLTVTSFMENIEYGRSTLEQYWDCEF